MKKKDFLPYTLLFIQPIFMASNLVVARGGVEFVPPISLAFWRWLSVFLLLMLFNYGILYKKKILLKEYVNSISNSPALKTYINNEIKKVKLNLAKYSKKVEDKAVAVKLNETKTMIKPLCKKSFVNDNNVINLLNYYELINELKTIHG